MKKSAILAALLALTFCAPLQAKQVLLSGQVNHDRITQLTSSINWYHSLGQAESEATHQGKMIFWMHILGSLSGET